jgi:hypothetical protein
MSVPFKNELIFLSRKKAFCAPDDRQGRHSNRFAPLSTRFRREVPEELFPFPLVGSPIAYHNRWRVSIPKYVGIIMKYQ